MSERSPFRRIAVKRPQIGDIESLFKDLKNRDPNIKDLYSQQADVLREYYNRHLESKDVSIELPTGSGKTLVGLLIAEYRRRKLGERILYVCPTRQLAHQVGNHSKDYAIPTRVLVGPKRDYDIQDVHAYRSARATAVSTYSGIFNINPEFNDAQTIILDDAHGGESYISSLWSITIRRLTNPEFYENILSLFEKDLPSNLVSVLHISPRPSNPPKPEKVPFGAFHRTLGRLREVLDALLPDPQKPDLYFPWQVVRDGLHACHVYVSWDQILIRPYIAPTMTHKPFADANQRIYMSATLGSGGELERTTGIRKIERIPIPKTYLKQGIGRRLFLFPDQVALSQGYEPWLAKTIRDAGRALGLCPTGESVQTLVNIAGQLSSPPEILGPSDIEDSLKPFSDAKSALLALANRYDGLDIPSKDCRLLLIYGLPSGTNLQESFLEGKLGLDVLLRERVKTRISQAAGRCTRSDTDYAAIIMVGRRLLNFCIKHENQWLFNPELRAEIQFSLDQEAKDLAKLDSMLNSFFDKDESWTTIAEPQIVTLREAENQIDSKIPNILADVVADEVDFAYSLWSGDLKTAVKHGNAVTDKLTDSRLSAYRALWFYFTAYAAYAASSDDQEYGKISEKMMSRAVQTCKTVSWFATALKSMLPTDKLRAVASGLETITTEGIADVLQDLGSTGPGFSHKMDEVEELLKQKDHSKFDRGLQELGRLLGFTSWRPTSQAAPDCVWQLGSDVAFLLEGKSEESSEGPISVDDCRQAGGHLKWARAEQALKDCKYVFSILVTPRTQLDKTAIPHAKELYMIQPIDMLKLFERTRAMLTTVRSTMVDQIDEEFKERILSELIRTDLTPTSIQEVLLAKPLC